MYMKIDKLSNYSIYKKKLFALNLFINFGLILIIVNGYWYIILNVDKYVLYFYSYIYDFIVII